MQAFFDNINTKVVDDLRFIFTAPSFVQEKESKQRREFYIPRIDRERALYGSPFEVKLRKQLPKKAIYAKFELKPAQRDHFDADISKLTIVNAISTTTIPALQKGDNVECIYVVNVNLKRLNLDKIWENLITDLGDITIEDGNSLEDQIAADEAKAKLEKQLADLEKKARNEKQPRKRLELFEQLKKLKGSVNIR